MSDPEGLAAGTQVAEFQIMRLLGRGGMGDVYLARDTVLGRKVALKFLRTAFAGDQMLVEAQAIARFSHPHIVNVYSFGEHEGRPFAALEYVDGPSLRERMQVERPGLREALRLALAIAQALAEAHRSHVLHRDLKPENVLLGRDGRLRVVDFGLAKLVEGDGPPPASIVERAGTPAYMAPEQWLLAPVTEATDVWALGIILYELAFGQHPFRATTVQELGELVLGRTPSPPPSAGLPEALVELTARCLERDATRRPSAAEIAEVLDSLVTGEGRSARESPFRGLLAFTERDAGLFFGRDEEVAAAVEQLREQPLLTVVGPSGAGKSSFLRAGVIPRLRDQGAWAILTLRPGDRPFRALAQTLGTGDHPTAGLAETTPSGPGRLADARPREPDAALADELRRVPGALGLALRRLAAERHARVLLFVDQLEELYTLTADAETRQAFILALASAADDAADPVRVCLSVRDDFLGHLAEGAEVRTALSRVTVMRSPSAGALREILTRPLASVGYAYDDPALIDEMIAVIAGEATGLPLLQFALRTLWERRDEDRRLLLRSAYEAMGGVGGALAEQGDGVLAELPPDEVRLARELLLRLITPEETRRVLPRSRLLEGLDARAGAVLDRLIAARLLTTSRTHDRSDGDADVELAHESLISRWARLRRWLDEGKEELAFLAEVEQAAELWQRRGRRADEVWHGDALEQADKLRQRLGERLPAAARAFLDEGARRERRGRRVVVGAAAAAFCVLAAVGVVSVTSIVRARDRAEHDRAVAVSEQAVAEREAAQGALLAGDPVQAAARLRDSLEVEDSTLSRGVLAAIERQPLVARRALVGAAYHAKFSPSGREVAAGGQDSSVWIMGNGAWMGRRLEAGDQVNSLAFSGDGKLLVGGMWNGDILAWDLPSGTRRALTRQDGVKAVRPSADGSLLVSGSEDGLVRIWRDGAARVLEGHTASVNAIALSPDERTIASASWDGTVRLWDVASGTTRLVLSHHGAPVKSVGFTPDGRAVVSAGGDGAVRLSDAASGAELHVFRGPAGSIEAATISPAGDTVAGAGQEGTVWLWELASGARRAVLEDTFGNRSMVSDLSFSPDGRLLASAHRDGVIRIWEPGRVTRRPEENGYKVVYGTDFSPDGRFLAVAAAEPALYIHDVDIGRRLGALNAGGSISLVAYGKDFIVAGRRQPSNLVLWRLPLGGAPEVLEGHRDTISSVAVSRDSRTIASGSADRTARLWDAATGRPLAVLKGEGGPVYSVAFATDGRLVAVGSGPTIQLHALDGRLLQVLSGHRFAVMGLGFRADGALLSASLDGTVRLWRRRPAGDGYVPASTIAAEEQGRVYAVSWHPDGRRAVRAGSNGLARIWDLETGRTITLVGHHDEVNAVRFSPDGRLCATGGDDGTARMWDVDTGRPVWRAPLLVAGEGVELYSQRGWTVLDGQARAGRDWRRVIPEARVASQSASLRTLCVAGEASVEMWDLAADRRRLAGSVVGADEVLATDDACLVLAGGVAWRLDAGGTTRLAEGVTAAAVDGDAFLLARGEAIERHGAVASTAIAAGGRGVTALLPYDGGLVLGFVNGRIERRAGGAAIEFSGVLTSRVVRLAAGPRDTVVAGFASGAIGLWFAGNGSRLDFLHLHGSARHLLYRAGRLFAASDLGDWLSADLGVYEMSRCDLVRTVWREIPVRWEGGVAVVRDPPRDDACYR